MHPEAYRFLSQREKNYWWHAARRSLSFNLLQRQGLKIGAQWLDLGCGTGGNFLLDEKIGATRIVGLDKSSFAIAEAAIKFPKVTLISSDLNQPLPFANDEFDVITIFNVLYHEWIADELPVIREARRVLRPGGLMLITEPAFPFLAREMDIAAMGKRRYRARDLAALCGQAGLEVKASTYFTSFGLPLLLADKILQKIRTGVAIDMRSIGPVLNGVLHALALFEVFFLSWGLRSAFGTTALCLAEKPRSS